MGSGSPGFQIPAPGFQIPAPQSMGPDYPPARRDHSLMLHPPRNRISPAATEISAAHSGPHGVGFVLWSARFRLPGPARIASDFYCLARFWRPAPPSVASDIFSDRRSSSSPLRPPHRRISYCPPRFRILGPAFMGSEFCHVRQRFGLLIRPPKNGISLSPGGSSITRSAHYGARFPLWPATSRPPAPRPMASDSHYIRRHFDFPPFPRVTLQQLYYSVCIIMPRLDSAT